MTSPPEPVAAPSASARIVHLTLMGGIVLFVAFSWYTVRSREPVQGNHAPLYMALSVMTVGMVAAAMLVARRIERPSSTETTDGWWIRNMSRAMIVWSLSEAPALFGGVVYLVSGDSRALLATLIGLLLMLRFAPGRLARRD